MTVMKTYKIECDFMGRLLTAVVACENAADCLELAGFVGEDYSEQEVVWIGDSIYTEPTLICREAL